MLIVGLVLLVVAIGAAWFARSARAHARTATATETLACADLTALAEGVGAEVGGGSFRQRCEVVGRAAHADDQVTEAPESKQAAVWHRTQVTRRYWTMERREREGKTEWDRVEHSETVTDLSSELAFAVEDGTGRVLVAPLGADIDHAEKVVDRFDRGDERVAAGVAGAVEGVLTAALLGGSGGERSGTIGFQTEEWVIRPGAQLYVLGEVSDQSGRLCFAKPDKGRFLVSTRSEEQLVAEHRRRAVLGTSLAAVSAVAGVACVAAGLVA